MCIDGNHALVMAKIMPLNFTMHVYTHNDITNSGPVYKKVVAKYSLTFVKIAEI